jgi:hypothetical protein
VAEDPIHSFIKGLSDKRRIDRSTFHYKGILGPAGSYQTTRSPKPVSSAYIVSRISNHERSMKINGVLTGRYFVQESSWLLALARLAKTMRTNIRAENLSTESAKTSGKGIEPLSEFIRRKIAPTDSALNSNNRA